MSKLTILSFGGGQDSTALLYKLIYDPRFRKEYAPDRLWVVMANTMNEHSATYLHVVKMKSLCKEHSIPFYFLQPRDWAPKSWSKGLIEFYRAGNRIGSKCFPKTCTDNLKIKPIYNFLEEEIHKQFQLQKVGRKRAFYEFTSHYGKVDVLIGIAHGEETRASSNADSPYKWMRECVNKRYPLIKLKLDRQGCQNLIKQYTDDVPPPSNCILCPFMSEQELLYLYYKERSWYDEWVKLEQAKIDANLHMGDRNMGVWGNKLLPEKLEDAKKKYGHMTMEDLHEYKMSHGHCVKSKY
jgi:hypothetical protein